MASSVDRNRKFFKRIRSLNSSSIQGIIQAFQLTGLLRWQKLPWFFQHFLLDLWLSQFNSAFAVSFHFSERRSSHVSQWFSWTNHNSLLRITTNEIASFCIENRLRQMDFYVFAKLGKGCFWIKIRRFWNKKCCSSLLLYYIKQIDSMLPCVCSEGNLSTRRFWSDGDVYKRAWVRGRRRSRQIPNLSKEEFLRRQPFRNLLRKLRKPAVRKMSSWNKRDAVTSVWW